MNDFCECEHCPVCGRVIRPLRPLCVPFVKGVGPTAYEPVVYYSVSTKCSYV